MFFHPFNTVPCPSTSYGLEMQRGPHSFISPLPFFKTFLTGAGQLTIWCMMLCIGIVANPVEARTERDLNIERGRFEEEESRRGQRHGLTPSTSNIEAWREGNLGWLTDSGSSSSSRSSNSSNPLSSWESLNTDTSLGSFNTSSTSSGTLSSQAQSVSSDEVFDYASLNSLNTGDGSETDSVRSDASERMLTAPFPNLMADHPEQTLPALHNADNPHSISSTSSIPTMAAEDHAIASQHSSGMDFQIPVIEASGAASGSGLDDNAAANQTISSHSDSASVRSDEPASEQLSANTTNTKMPVPVPVAALTHHAQKAPAHSVPPSATTTGSKPIKQAQPLDQQVLKLSAQMERDKQIAYRGISMAMAMPNFSPSEPGKTTIAVGTARFRGESAIGVGMTHRSSGGAVQFNIAVSGTSTSEIGARAQVAYEF